MEDGLYYINNIPSATLSFYRGTQYTFILLNTEQSTSPFMIGTDIGVPYLGGYITVKQGSYYTVFTVKINDPNIKKLVYYSPNNLGMTGIINIVNNPANPVLTSFQLADQQSSRELAVAADDDGFMIPFDQTCTGDYKVGDPRAVLRMSLYCAVSRMDQFIPANILSKPYVISSTCDKIVKTFMNTQASTVVSQPPLQYCGQSIKPIDTCTVQAPVSNFIGGTCKEYCEGLGGGLLII